MAKDTNDEDKGKENSEENFGLPDIEYKPLEESSKSSTQEPSSSGSSGYTYGGSGGSSDSYQVEEPKSKGPMIMGIVIVLVIAVGGYLFYNYYYKPRAAAEKAKKEQEARDRAEANKRAEEARLAKLKEDAEKRRLDSIANATPPVGTIEMLSARTKRYYVVITSVIDDDLLMDYAKKLSTQGVSTKVIPPFGGKKFYRLAIADHETFALAQTNADAVKANYGDGVWVIKY